MNPYEPGQPLDAEVVVPEAQLVSGKRRFPIVAMVLTAVFGLGTVGAMFGLPGPIAALIIFSFAVSSTTFMVRFTKWLIAT